ncbi:MAG: hypothetical protein SWY16_00270 [Cyanobacteriota bacterium]|nr:hypothetical protein [Cyanobacteriota bacterium]
MAFEERQYDMLRWLLNAFESGTGTLLPFYFELPERPIPCPGWRSPLNIWITQGDRPGSILQSSTQKFGKPHSLSNCFRSPDRDEST